jgi:hypothetical protein
MRKQLPSDRVGRMFDTGKKNIYLQLRICSPLLVGAAFSSAFYHSRRSF